jgi:Xaa-Pro dipeptidase
LRETDRRERRVLRKDAKLRKAAKIHKKETDDYRPRFSARRFALVFPAKGELAWVAPAFEKGRALEQIKFGNDVRTWQEDESPYQLVASILKDRGVASGKLGVEETVRFVFSDGVAKAAPGLKLTSADPVTARCRRVKSAHEIELIRLANQITLKAFEITLKLEL